MLFQLSDKLAAKHVSHGKQKVTTHAESALQSLQHLVIRKPKTATLTIKRGIIRRRPSNLKTIIKDDFLGGGTV